MHCISRSLFTCIASCTLAITSASAAVHALSIATAPLVATSAASSAQTPTSRASSASRRPSRAPTRAARKKTRKASALKPPARATTYKGSNKNFAAAEKAVQAESSARMERLYRASQFSAPIIIDAKACKRVGTHGESIYENC